MKAKGLLIVLGCAASAGIGYAAGYFVAKRKTEARLDEEIASVKEAFIRNLQDITDETSEQEPVAPTDPLAEKPNIMEYAKITNQYKSSEDKEEADQVETNSIRVITPEEFSFEEEYGCTTLYFTSNGYLIDEDDELVVETLPVVGMTETEIESHFGEYEDDSVYVVDDDKQVYYEILRSEKEYVEE